mmetsp:Transcript_74044/g.120208  ORF Transcript_74044/g.120208 Transcript_74044/m.120208 type:complete len:140 (-) Transcript_74044:1145-1564(-)
MVVWFEWCAAKWGINASSLLRSSASALLREHAAKPNTRILFLKSVDPLRMQSQEDLPSSSTAHCSFGACGHERHGSLQMGSNSVSAACQGRPRSHVARHADTWTALARRCLHFLQIHACGEAHEQHQESEGWDQEGVRL